MIQVSIVIVCMNNLKNLFPCLNSIKEQTEISYEVFVVAYLFSKENLNSLRSNYSWVQIIESNEIRGFSENNNMALRKAKGKYCFVLNDDTILKMPVVDILVSTIEMLPDNVAVVSPKTVFADGTLQSCGRPRMNVWTFIGGQLRIWKEQKCKSRYINQEGVFQSYNIVGAAFLIKTTVFEQIGFFNEAYFFCPEDIEVGTILNKKGYTVFVNADCILYHLEGGTAREIYTATMPSSTQGSLLFFSGKSKIKFYCLTGFIKIQAYIKWKLWKFKIKAKSDRADILSRSNKNIFDTIGSNLTPKEIFIRYYSQIKMYTTCKK